MSPTYVIKRETQKKGISYRTVEEWPMEVLDSLFSPLPSIIQILLLCRRPSGFTLKRERALYHLLRRRARLIVCKMAQQFHLLKRWTQMKVWINWTSSGGTQLLSQLTTSRSQLSHFIRQLLLILKSVTVRMSGRSVVDIRLVAGVSCWLETNNTQWTWLK
jgi:hypothetical protein